MGAPKKRPMLTAAQILERVGVREEEYELPGIGGCVLLRGVTKDAQIRARAEANVGGDEDSHIEVTLFRHGVVDPETKEPLFTTEQIIELKKLMSGVEWDHVVNRIGEITAPSEKEGKAVAATFPSD